MIGIHQTQVVRFGQAESARLKEIILRSVKFFEVIARLDDRAVTARSTLGQERQQARFAAVLKNHAAEGIKIVSETAGDQKRIVDDLIIIGAALIAERVSGQIDIVDQKASHLHTVGAHHRIIPTQPGVKDGVVKLRETNIAVSIITFVQPNGVGRKGAVAENALVDDLLGQREAGLSDHGDKPGIAAGTNGRRLAENAFAVRVAIA